MNANWNPSWPDIAAGLTTAGQVVVVCLLAYVYARQRRLHRLALTQLDRLAAITRTLSPPRPARQNDFEVIRLDERRS